MCAFISMYTFSIITIRMAKFKNDRGYINLGIVVLWYQTRTLITKRLAGIKTTIFGIILEACCGSQIEIPAILLDLILVLILNVNSEICANVCSYRGDLIC